MIFYGKLLFDNISMDFGLILVVGLENLRMEGFLQLFSHSLLFPYSVKLLGKGEEKRICKITPLQEKS